MPFYGWMMVPPTYLSHRIYPLMDIWFLSTWGHLWTRRPWTFIAKFLCGVGFMPRSELPQRAAHRNCVALGGTARLFSKAAAPFKSSGEILGEALLCFTNRLETVYKMVVKFQQPELQLNFYPLFSAVFRGECRALKENIRQVLWAAQPVCELL